MNWEARRESGKQIREHVTGTGRSSQPIRYSRVTKEPAGTYSARINWPYLRVAEEGFRTQAEAKAWCLRGGRHETVWED